MWRGGADLDEPMVRVAKTIRKHSAGILAWLRSRISNGMLEAMNSLVQAAKGSCARGYRTTEEPTKGEEPK